MTSTQPRRELLFRAALDGHVDGARARDLFPAFMQLSRVLLAADDLEDWLGRAYFGTLRAGAARASEATFYPKYSDHDVRRTLETFDALAGATPRPDLEAAVQRALLTGDDPCVTVARSIAALWYCAGLLDLSPAGQGFMTLAAPRETLASARIWATFGGNPMGVPGSYYGAWSYPPPIAAVAPEDLP